MRCAAVRVSGRIPFRAGRHRGVDLRAAPGSRGARGVLGPGASTARLGVVTLRCGRWRVTHLPLRRVAVRAGARVRAGTIVGEVGVRPGHAGLHLGVRRAGDRFGVRRPAAAPARRAAPPPPVPRAAPRAGSGRTARGPAAPGPRRRRAAPAARLPAAPPARGAAAPRPRVRRPSRGGSVPAGRWRLGPPGPGSRCSRSASPAVGRGSGCGAHRARARGGGSVRAMIAALLIGFGLGASVAAQLGPMSLLAIRSTLRNGVRVGLAIGAGIAVIDTLYAAAGRGGRGSDPLVRAAAARGGDRRRGRARLSRGEDAVERVPDPARRRDRRGAGHAAARVRRRARRDRVEPADDRVLGGGVRRGLDGRRGRGLGELRAAGGRRASAAWRG